MRVLLSWSSSTLATWYGEPTHWKTPWCWEGLRAGGEGATEDETVGWHHRLNEHEFGQAPGDSEETKDPGMLRSMRSQRVGHNLATEQLLSNLFSYAHLKSLGLFSSILWVSGQRGSWPPLIKMNQADLEVLALFLLWRTSLFPFFLFI